MKKLIVLLFLIAISVVLFRGFSKPKVVQPLGIATHAPTVTTQNQISPESTVIPAGQPETLSIPAINITAPIESVGMDSEGRMDVPKKADNVAWYNLGFKPGEKGSAVIDGHFDRVTGAPAVFYKLNALKKGDQILVTDTNGKKLTFSVTESMEYPYDSLPMQKVFNTTDKPRLNLITCDGTFDQSQKNYSKRLVVYAELSQ